MNLKTLENSINEAIVNAKRGKLLLQRCGEIIRRKFARDFANRVAWCYDDFRPGDTCLQDALQTTRRWLRGIASPEQLVAAREYVVAAERHTFNQRTGLAAVMRVLEIFTAKRHTFRKFYLRISAVKTFRTVKECLMDVQRLDVERVADEARQAMCVHEFYERPSLAMRHLRRGNDVPAVFKNIRDDEQRWQCDHVAGELQQLCEPAAIRMLHAHAAGNIAARAYFWDWCEERGIDLCPQTSSEECLEFVGDFSCD